MIEIEYGLVMMYEYECHCMRMIKNVVVMLCLLLFDVRETCFMICALYVIGMWHRMNVYGNGRCKGIMMRIVV